MDKDDNPASLSSEDLVERAVADHLFFKKAAFELAHRPPSTTAAQRLMAAFGCAAAPPWLTAHLLGCIRDETGYETAREILLQAPGQLAESYAGVALARIRGTRAFDDLCQILRSAPQQRSREGAASGLARLPSTNAATVILEVALLNRIRYTVSAFTLAELRLDPAMVNDLLTTGDRRAIRLGSEIVWQFVLDSRARPSTDVSNWLDEAQAVVTASLRRVLASPAVTMSPRKRRELDAWLLGKKG